MFLVCFKEQDRDAERFHYDLHRNLTRFTGNDAILRVRSSSELSVLDYITSGGKTSMIEVELSSVNADTSILVTLKQDEKIQEKSAYLQAALLYTNPYGDRVIRIINFAFNVTNETRKKPRRTKWKLELLNGFVSSSKVLHGS